MTERDSDTLDRVAKLKAEGRWVEAGWEWARASLPGENAAEDSAILRACFFAGATWLFFQVLPDGASDGSRRFDLVLAELQRFMAEKPEGGG